MNSVYDTQLMLSGFPHSEIFGSKGVCHLPEAYRRLLRPSSPPTAKAFTVCAYSLDYIVQASKIFLRLTIFIVVVVTKIRRTDV